jgi:hypothetical protein
VLFADALAAALRVEKASYYLENDQARERLVRATAKPNLIFIFASRSPAATIALPHARHGAMSKIGHERKIIRRAQLVARNSNPAALGAANANAREQTAENPLAVPRGSGNGLADDVLKPGSRLHSRKRHTITRSMGCATGHARCLGGRCWRCWSSRCSPRPRAAQLGRTLNPSIGIRADLRAVG